MTFFLSKVIILFLSWFHFSLYNFNPFLSFTYNNLFFSNYYCLILNHTCKLFYYCLILKKVSVPTEIRPIVMVKNEKVEDDILCQKLSDFIVTSNIEIHVDVGELEKKETKTKAYSLLKKNLAKA